MNRITINYRRREFKKWKRRVNIQLQSLGLKLLSDDTKFKNFSNETLRQFGSVLEAINNPMYTIEYEGKRLSIENEIAFEVLLKIQVKKLFETINKT